MALYNNLVLTNAGAALVNAWVTGTAHDPVPITAVGIGDGLPAPEAPKEVTALVNEIKRLPAETAVLERGSLTVTARLSTDTIDADITHRELGVYSNDTLLAYGHAGDAYDYIPAAGQNTAVIKQITVHLSVGAIEVKLEPIDTDDYVTYADFEARIGELAPPIIEEKAIEWFDSSEWLKTITDAASETVKPVQEALDAHIGNTDLHLQEGERDKWNKTTTDLATHSADTSIHVQSADRSRWDAASTDSQQALQDAAAAQNSANKAADDLSHHAEDTSLHMLEGDRERWDNAASTVSEHVGDSSAHVSPEDRSTWNAATDLANTAQSSADAAREKAESALSELESHTTDTSVHLQADERDRWNTAAETADAAATAARTAQETAEGVRSALTAHEESPYLHYGSIENDDGSVSYMSNESNGGVMKYTSASGDMSKFTLFDGSDENHIFGQIVAQSGDKSTIARLNITTSGMFYSTGSDISVSPDRELAVKADISSAKQELEDAIKLQVESVLHYKGTVASVDALPPADNSVGDVYNVTDSGANYAWDGSAWDKLSETLDLSVYAQKSDLSAHSENTSIHLSDEQSADLAWLNSNSSALQNMLDNPPEAPEITVDLSYNAESANPQSGTAVAEAVSPLATKEELTAHVEDTAPHVSPEERTAWAKAAEDIESHAADTSLHLTPELLAALNEWLENKDALLTRNEIYEFIIDQTQSDPEAAVTYAGANAGFKPMSVDLATGAVNYGSWNGSWLLNRFKPCMLKFDGSLAYYLDKSNLTKKADGGDASADIANPEHDMNAMVEVGQIWIKEVAETSDRFHIYLSPTAQDGYDCWTHYNTKNKLLDNIYVAMYRGSKDSAGKMRSLSGQAPNVSEAGNRQRGYCQANGTGWDINTWSMHRLMGYVVTLLGKSLNSQAVFGTGIEKGEHNPPSAAVVTGGTEEKGWFWGTNTDNSAHVRVLGMEDLWGNVWDLVGGIILGDGNIYVKMTPGTADGSTGTDFADDSAGYVSIGNPGVDTIFKDEVPPDEAPSAEPSAQESPGIGEARLEPDNSYDWIAGMKLVPGKGLFPANTGGGASQGFCDYVWWNLQAKCWARVGCGWSFASGVSGVFALAVHFPLSYSHSDFGASPAFKRE